MLVHSVSRQSRRSTNHGTFSGRHLCFLTARMYLRVVALVRPTMKICFPCWHVARRCGLHVVRWPDALHQCVYVRPLHVGYYFMAVERAGVVTRCVDTPYRAVEETAREVLSESRMLALKCALALCHSHPNARPTYLLKTSEPNSTTKHGARTSYRLIRSSVSDQDCRSANPTQFFLTSEAQCWF